MVCTKSWKHDAWDGDVGDRPPSRITLAIATKADPPWSLWKKAMSGTRSGFKRCLGKVNGNSYCSWGRKCYLRDG